MKLASVLLCAAAMPLAAQEAVPVDPSQNPAADYVLDGPTVFTAAAGTTNVYSGAISGVGPAIIDGGGLVAFSNPGNTYEGGTLVSNAVFRLDADGCAGVNAITAAVRTAHIYLNCARIPYSIYFASYYDQASSGINDATYPGEGRRPLYPLVSDVTVTGKVSFTGYTYFSPGNSKDRYSRTNKLTFEDECGMVGNSSIIFTTYGTTVFKGRYRATTDTSTGNQYLGQASSAEGDVYFHSSSNVFYKVRLYSADQYLKASDAYPRAHLIFDYGAKNRSKIDMGGYDQAIRGISMRMTHDVETEDSTGHSFISSTDRTATLRITGFEKGENLVESGAVQDSLTNRVAFLGNMSLVMDVNPTFTATGFVQVFDQRKNTMTGDLVISNGVFGMVGTVSFPNVPNIYIGTGGAITCATIRANAFAGCTNLVIDGNMAFDDCVETPFGYKAVDLTLGDDAKLALPASYTLTVPSLKVGDTVMGEGTYGDGEGAIHLDQLLRGTIVVEGNHENVAATWTGGGGSDTSMETDENWSTGTAPSLTDSTLLATFASGGTVATAESDMRLRGIVLSKSDTGFTIAGEGKTISLDAEGFTFTDTVAADPESPRTYTVEPVLSHFYEAATSFAVPSNVTLAFTGGFQQPFGGANSKTGGGTLVFNGNSVMPGGLNIDGGAVQFNGTNNIHGSIISKNADLTFAGENNVDGRVIISNATVMLTGKVTQEGGPPSNANRTWEWQPDSSTFLVNCATNNVYKLPSSRVTIDNLDMGKRFAMYGANYNATGKWFTVTAGSTNIFRAQFIIPGSVGYFDVGEDSLTRFAGAFSIGGETRIRGGGTLVFSGSTPDIGGGGICVRESTKVIFENAGHYMRGGSLDLSGTSYCDFLADNVITNNQIGKTFYGPAVFLRASSTLDIHDTKQTVFWFCIAGDTYKPSGDSPATLTGELGCEMRLCNAWVYCNVTGGVSITAAATNATDKITFTNKVFASCGDIKAESGTMVFAQNASWLNGTNVTVCSDATLQLNASGTFGDHAVLHTEGENWHLDLAEGVKQKFTEFLKDGVRQPNGIYGAEGNAAAKYRLANITGAGVIRVGKIGMVVSVR